MCSGERPRLSRHPLGRQGCLVASERGKAMEEDKLLLHVENLVPGYVTLFLLAAFVPPHLKNPVEHPDLAKLFEQPVVATLLVTAAAYLVGVVVFITSRLLVDTASQWIFRWLLLLVFGWKDFPRKNPKKINELYFETLKKALDESAKPLARREVIKRRERARLIRTALVPAALLCYQFSLRGLCVVAAIAAVVFLYAYAEVAVYQEAKLAA